MSITRVQKKVECPFCKKVYFTGGIASHFKNCKEMPVNISPEKRRESYLSHNYQIDIEDLIYQYSSYNSLPDLSKKFNNAPYTVICELLKSRGVEIRGVKNKQVNEKRMEKLRQTCQEKYGAPNSLSKDTVPYHKRNATVKKKYGVNTVFKNEEIKKKIQNDQTYLDRYGLTRKDHISKKGKEAWDRLSDEEKTLWYERSIGSAKAVKRAGVKHSSRLESRIKIILSEKRIDFDSQFMIYYVDNNKKRWFLYDILLSDTNILIEINGDYWHANPAIYKSTDLIHYRKGNKYAIDVWAKDQKKRKIANESGYVVLELWEQDLSQMSDEEILQTIYEFIRRTCDDVDETKEN